MKKMLTGLDSKTCYIYSQYIVNITVYKEIYFEYLKLFSDSEKVLVPLIGEQNSDIQLNWFHFHQITYTKISVNIYVTKLLISKLQPYIGYRCKILAFCELISHMTFIIKSIVYFFLNCVLHLFYNK